MTISAESEYSGVTGSAIFFADSTRLVMPAQRMSPATVSAARYSIRPCPRGWSMSASADANFVPMMVTTEETASLMLLTASRTTEMELAARPMNAFTPARAILVAIPT